jgi:uncharacterized Tic20 family protein
MAAAWKALASPPPMGRRDLLYFQMSYYSFLFLHAMLILALLYVVSFSLSKLWLIGLGKEIKVCISLSFMKDRIAGYSSLGWHLLFFQDLEWIISFSTCFIVSVEKSADLLLGLLLFLTWLFSLVAFSIVSLFYIVNILIIIGLREILFWSCLLGVPQAYCTWWTFVSQDWKLDL